MPLRQIAYISDLPVFSVQNALKKLLVDKVIKKRKKGHFLLFEINKESPYYNFLKELFFIEMKNLLRAKALKYSSKAKSVLYFVNSAINFFRNIKRNKK